jgi:hypothetical protein
MLETGNLTRILRLAEMIDAAGTARSYVAALPSGSATTGDPAEDAAPSGAAILEIAHARHPNQVLTLALAMRFERPACLIDRKYIHHSSQCIGSFRQSYDRFSFLTRP